MQYLFHGTGKVDITTDGGETFAGISRADYRQMAAVESAIVEHDMHVIDVPMYRAVNGAGIATGGVYITRMSAVDVEGKRETVPVPFMFLPVNSGNIFPTRFYAEKVYDEKGFEKLDKSGRVIRKKRGFKSYYTNCIKTTLDAVIFAAFSGRGIYRTHADFVKLAD